MKVILIASFTASILNVNALRSAVHFPVKKYSTTGVGVLIKDRQGTWKLAQSCKKSCTDKDRLGAMYSNLPFPFITAPEEQEAYLIKLKYSQCNGGK